MFRKIHRQIQQIVQRLRNMANNRNNKNLDAETSKLFVEADAAHGVDAFEVGSLQIPQTARPETTSPLEKTLAEEQGKGSSSTRFTPTPRPGPKADKSEAEAQPHKVPRDAWRCCRCEVTNPLAGLVCWACQIHYACPQCQSA